MYIFPTFPPFFIRKVLFCPESRVKWMANAQIMPIKIEKEVQEVTPSQPPLRSERHKLFDMSDCPEGTTDRDWHIPFWPLFDVSDCPEGTTDHRQVVSEAKPLLCSAPPTECRRYDRIVSAALSGLASPTHMKQGLHPCLWSYSPFRTFPWALSIQSGYSYFNQSTHNSKEIRLAWQVLTPIQPPPSLHYLPNVCAGKYHPTGKQVRRVARQT